ncbi:MAG: hydrolase, partial [Myxococcota bacterium]|nr:hydrolase [Myxococcota bacterium]
LPAVRAPTLLLVGERDEPVIGMNREAAARMRVEHRLEIVPGATHLFEEPGALEAVARRAAAWFALHLAGRELRVGAPPEAPRLPLEPQGHDEGDRR